MYFISKSVSRVLSFKIVIYLGHILLYASSHAIQKVPSKLNLLLRCCSRWGLHCPSMSPYQRWALTSPFHPYLTAVIFCCTFLKVALTGRYPASLLCGARTFLVRCLSALLYATIQLTPLLFYYIKHSKSNFYASMVSNSCIKFL